MTRWLLFTDLDGTLLSHRDYDWSAAAPALGELRSRKIPLVFASSKTRAEIEAWRRQMGNRDPFISENGGALYVPFGFTADPISGAVRSGGYECRVFGTTYQRLRQALPRLAESISVPLRGFGDMTTEEIAQRTGLDHEYSALAAQREYDEPFVSARELNETELNRLESEARTLGLRITRGGRFYHLLGSSSKGAAARSLIAAFQFSGEVKTAAFGDGPNDLELLQVVDHPVVVARPDETHAPELRKALPNARFTRTTGPHGFTEAVIALLSLKRPL